MKVTSQVGKPQGYQPVTATITFETVKEAAIFRCIFGNQYVSVPALLASTSLAGANISGEDVRALMMTLRDAVPMEVYDQARAR